MQTITKYLIIFILSFSMQFMYAQEQTNKEESIEMLVKLKKSIEQEEREALKTKVEAINQRLDRGDINQSEADRLKKAAAEKHALNIENRIAIIDNKIELLQRNGYISKSDDNEDDNYFIRIGGNKDEKENFIFFGKRRHDKPRRYDRRTSSDMVLAFGLNNAIIEGENFDDTPYKIGGSRFFEIGWAWKTRVFENSNWLRLKYGYSFQINGFKPKDNMYFTQNNNETMLEEFSSELKKSKLSITNLVFPLHFEFGPSRRIDREDYFRYTTRNQFKIGIGGYAGFNIGTRQKLKYSLDGENVKDKMKKSFNTTSLVYGLSGYIAFDDTAIYVKYDMSPIFKDQAIKQNNISLGLRFDMD